MKLKTGASGMPIKITPAIEAYLPALKEAEAHALIDLIEQAERKMVAGEGLASLSPSETWALKELALQELARRR